MDSIRIDSGVKRIAINDDESRVIEFNPSDITFAERFFALYRDLLARARDYDARAQMIDADDAVDDEGLPLNAQERLAFQREVIEYMHGAIDQLFGAGTSETVFGGTLNIDAVLQFLDGITPFVQRARAEKVEKYRPAKGKRPLR